MLYHSLNTDNSGVSLRDALLSTGTKDGSLYMPDSFPLLPRAFFNNCSEMRAGEIAYVVDNLLFGQDLSSSEIKDIVDTSLSFPIPVVKIEENVYVLELFHGPTMTIKDISTRFTARMLKSLGVKGLNLVLATTGNNGAAVANCIHNVDSFRAFVLFPKGTSRSIVARFTGLSGNVHAIEVDGTIADCRRITQSLVNDAEIANKYKVSRAGTVNLGHILPSVFLYVYAYAQVMKMTNRIPNVQFALPMANGGTLTQVLFAKHMGLPMLAPIAGKAATPNSAAYALNVNNPSNQPRISALGDEVIYDSVTDEEIAETINSVYARSGYTFDPHGAVAYAALKRNLAPGATGIVLATAHPALSINKMTEITGRAIELPLSLTRFMGIQPDTVKIPPTYPAFKRYLNKF